MKLAFRVAIGLIGLLIGCYGFMMVEYIAACGGECGPKWDTMRWFAFVIPIFTPISFVALSMWNTVKNNIIVKLLLFGLVLDFLLLMLTLYENYSTAWNNLAYAIGYWSIWQIVVLIIYFLQVRNNWIERKI